MKTTISVIGAGVGSFPGRSRVHPRLLEEAAKRLKEQEGGLLIDSFVTRCGDGLELVMTHARGIGDEEIRRLACEVLLACAGIAKGMRLHGVDRELFFRRRRGRGRDGVRGAGVGAGTPVHGGRSAGGRLELPPLQDLRRPVHHPPTRERSVHARRVRLRGPRPRRDAGGHFSERRRSRTVCWPASGRRPGTSSGTSSRRRARSRPRPRSGYRTMSRAGTSARAIRS